jgi:hypothetical protein
MENYFVEENGKADDFQILIIDIIFIHEKLYLYYY